MPDYLQLVSHHYAFCFGMIKRLLSKETHMNFDENVRWISNFGILKLFTFSQNTIYVLHPN